MRGLDRRICSIIYAHAEHHFSDDEIWVFAAAKTSDSCITFTVAKLKSYQHRRPDKGDCELLLSR